MNLMMRRTERRVETAHLLAMLLGLALRLLGAPGLLLGPLLGLLGRLGALLCGLASLHLLPDGVHLHRIGRDGTACRNLLLLDLRCQ